MHSIIYSDKKFAYVWVEEPRRPYTKMLMGSVFREWDVMEKVKDFSLAV